MPADAGDNSVVEVRMAPLRQKYTLEEVFALLRARLAAWAEARRREIEREYQADLAALDRVYRLENDAEPPRAPVE